MIDERVVERGDPLLPAWILVVCALTTGVAGCITVCRLALRLHRAGKWQLEDLAIVAAWLCSVVVTIGTTIFSGLLIRHHKQWHGIERWNFCTTVFFYLGAFATQLSVTLSWRHLFKDLTCLLRGVPHLLFSMLFLGVTVELVSYMALCHGNHVLWSADLERSCIKSRTSELLLLYYPSIFRCGYDLILVLVPAPFIWGLNLRMPQRLGFVFLSIMGIMVAGASLRRIFILQWDTQTKRDPSTWNSMVSPCLLLWSCLEINIGIVCANLVAFRGVLVDNITKFWQRNERMHAIPKVAISDLSEPMSGHSPGTTPAMSTKSGPTSSTFADVDQLDDRPPRLPKFSWPSISSWLRSYGGSQQSTIGYPSQSQSGSRFAHSKVANNVSGPTHLASYASVFSSASSSAKSKGVHSTDAPLPKLKLHTSRTLLCGSDSIRRTDSYHTLLDASSDGVPNSPTSEMLPAFVQLRETVGQAQARSLQPHDQGLPTPGDAPKSSTTPKAKGRPVFAARGSSSTTGDQSLQSVQSNTTKASKPAKQERPVSEYDYNYYEKF